jgi:putative nucleotidyltransferase with HDIG domain
MSLLLSRTAAATLLEDWVESPSLRRHCLAVSLAVAAYAVKLGGDEEQWAVAGLLHDMDYERHPDLDDEVNGHPRTALRVLTEMDVDPVVVRAIASHADFLGVSRDSDLERALFACDELCGFLLACAYVRPQGLHGLSAKSVKKKLKQPSFAAAVNRDDVREGAAGLGVEFDEHVMFVIAALEPHAVELGADGSPDADP